MKYFPRVLLAALLLTSLHSFANSVTFSDLNVNLTIYPNNGSGDNLYGTIFGNGVNLQVGGGTPFWWGFNNLFGAAPGSGGGGDTTIYFDSAQGQLGSQYYGSGATSIYAAVFDAGYFTFPTNGKNFTVMVPATLGLVAVLGCNSSCQTYNLISVPGHLVLSFDYNAPNGLYYGTQGYFTTTIVPEPGTLALLAAGIGGIAWRRRRR
jgi:hypothetical protein